MPRTNDHCGKAPPLPIGSPALLQDICTDSVGCLSRLHREYGRLVAYPNGPDLTVFAFGPEANYTVFTNPQVYHVAGPPGPRGSSQRRFQQGMFGLNGPQHLAHKRLLLHTLSKEAVAGQAAAMTELIERYLDSWRPGQQIDLYAAMKELALIIAGKLLFGLDEIPNAREVAATFQDWLDCFIASYFEMVLPVKAPPGSYERMLTTATTLEAHFRELIRLRQAQLKDSDGDLLALLLKALQAGRIKEVEVIGEMQTLLNASYQTTASGLTWTLLLLAQHPQVLHELYQQLRASVFPRPDEPSLLDRVIKESLRVLPPVVFPLRRTALPATLLGQPLPANTYVIVSYYVTHHQAEIFPEPERFLPDRWLRGNVSPWAYLPFSAGPRMCMGTTFSLQMFQIVLAAMVRRYRLALSPGTQVDRHSNLTLGVDGSLPVRVVAQDGRFSAVPLTGNIHEMVQLPQRAIDQMAS